MRVPADGAIYHNLVESAADIENPGKEGVVVRLKKERYLFGYPVCSKVKIGRRKYLVGSNMDLNVNESVFIEKSVYVQGKARVWLLLNVKPSSF